MFARFDENLPMNLQDIKETKRYRRTHAQTHGRMHGRTDNVKTVYPPQTKFAGGIKTKFAGGIKTSQSTVLQGKSCRYPSLEDIKREGR